MTTRSAKVKFSNLSKKGCGILIDLDQNENKNLKTCQNFFNKLQINEEETDLANLIKCLQYEDTIDNDLLTLQSSMILELRNIPEGLLYLDRYCSFLYDKIYKNWILATQDYIDGYIKKYEALINARRELLLKIKKSTMYKDLDDNLFIEGINKLSVVFLILEYADELSSYGYEKQASIIDKLNQILASKEGKFLKLKEKRNPVDLKALPEIYLKGIQYQLGCNCLCNTIFILSFLRILAKNQRLGKWKDPRIYENVSAYGMREGESGHTFISVNLDPLDPSFTSLKRFYIECTSNWAEYRRRGMDPLYKLDGQAFEVIVFKMIERFLHGSESILEKYRDGMILIDSSKIYTVTVRDYLLKNPTKFPDWFKIWSELFDEASFVTFQFDNPRLERTHRIILILSFLRKFYKIPKIFENVQSSLARDLILDPSILMEIKKEVKYRGVLLTEFLADWSLETEAPEIHNKVMEMARASRDIYKW